MRVAKAMVVTALMVVAGVAHAGDSAKMVLDLRTGPRASGGDETLAFSSLWDGGADATVTIAQDGVAIAENLAGEGERAWSVPYNGTYELTHVTYTNGVAGKVETATFVVTGKAEPPEITNVVATPSEPWDGTVSISFNVVNSPAAACPDWNQPYLSIVATDNVTGSNYVSVASALSGNTDAAGNGHAVTWDFKAQGIDFASTNVTFTVAYLRMPDWCVIDLSGGKDAAHYPVTYVSNVPKVSNVPNVPGVTFNADAYKTTNLVMRLIGPGTFKMGGTTETEITNAFYCAVFETTQRQWELVTGARPSSFKNETCYATRPVEKVSWNMIRGDAATYDWPNVQGVASDSFVGVLRQKTGLAALDLPAEAQWEYACRAGTTTDYNNGKNLTGDDYDTNLNEVARYLWNGGSPDPDHYEEPAQGCETDLGTAAVGSYDPNKWGLYDMHGNVWEWCLERYSSSWSRRVGRGGGWDDLADICTSSTRVSVIPSYGNYSFGFRLVRPLSDNLEGERSAEAAAGAERAGTVCAGTSAPVEVGAPPPEITDVAAAPTGGAWQGQVDISFNVTNDVARGLPDWNAPVLSIVATDHLTGSNYVADVSALSTRAPYQLADALAGSNGTHAVTWDFTAQGIDFSSTNVTFTVAYLRMPDYCVIDLSGGTNATGYAVSYLDAEPEGGFTNDLYRTTNLVMRLLAPGTFTMGVDGSNPDYNPPHEVTLTQPFYCAVFETTQKQWELVKGGNPSRYNGGTRPVEQVSWNMICSDSDNYLGALRSKTGLATLNLPTEAQWEYACRAGSTNRYNGVDTQDLGQLGRYRDNSRYDKYDLRGGYSEHTAVGSYLPNAWGLYDMHGNVFEWCLDGWDARLGNTSVTNPLSSSGSSRVVRGGSWYNYAHYCASSYRDIYYRSDGSHRIGFRLVRTLSDNLEGERSAEAAAGAERAGTVCAGTSASIAVGMREFADGDIKLTPYDAPYDGQPHTIGVRTNAIEGLTLKYAVGVGVGVGVGELTTYHLPLTTVKPQFTDVTNVTVYVEASAPGYYTTTNRAAVVITPKSVTVTARSEAFTYDGLTHSNALYDVEGLVGNDEISAVVAGAITFPRESPVTNVVASYGFTSGSAGNYTVATRSGELTMAAASQAITITAASGEWTYDGAGHATNAVSVTSGALLADDRLVAAATGCVTNVADTAAGNNPVAAGYKVMHGDEDVTDNYAITAVAGTLTIAPRPVTFTGKSETRKFSDSEIEIATVETDGLLNGHTHNVTFSAKGTEVGTHAGAITAKDNVRIADGGGADVTANYAVTVVNGALTIEQDANLAFEVMLEGATFAYDGAPHALPTNATATASSGVTLIEYSKDGGTWTNELSSLTATTVADSCAILVRATNPNYANPATNSAALTITKAANAWITVPSMAGWTIGATPASPNKGKAKFGTATVAYGKAGGAAGGLGATRPSAAGSYVATFTVPGTANYGGLVKNVSFTVKPKPPTTYTVKFSANGGTLPKGKSMAAQSFTSGKAAKLRGNAFTRKGYVFIGWAKSPKGAVAIRNGQSVKNIGKGGQTVTLYAVWAKAQYKVVFDASGGRGKMPVQVFTYGKPQKLAGNRFTRKGYVFGGWAIRDPLATIPKIAYKNGQAVKNLSADGKTVKLYAVWKRR